MIIYKVTAGGRTTDALFIVIACRPEWPPNRPLTAEEVHLDVSLSRQFDRHPQLQSVVKKVEDIVRHDLAIPHIFNYHRRYERVHPHHPFRDNLSPQNRYLQPIVLAEGMVEPPKTDQIRPPEPGVLDPQAQLDEIEAEMVSQHLLRQAYVDSPLAQGIVRLH